ncbi:MAG: rhodanese-like domain-containing protein [Cyclobacteriaceae bacterium]|nr:rhodanese-like domain-containing protein [Cyclobacteriaceae bacterium]
MKNFPLGILFILLTILTSCSAQQASGSKTINVTTFLSMRSKNTMLSVLDVRTPAEIAEGKIEGAMTMDYSQPDFSNRIDKLDKNQPIVVYCAVGGRSSSAAEIMRKKGFKEVYNLEGGIQAWRAAGQPLVK